MDDLPEHIVQMICLQIVPSSLLKLMCSSKNIYHKCAFEHFWKEYCYAHWSHEFWELAQKQIPSSCFRNISFYFEFKRLVRFESLWYSKYKRKIVLDDYVYIWNWRSSTRITSSNAIHYNALLRASS